MQAGGGAGAGGSKPYVSRKARRRARKRARAAAEEEERAQAAAGVSLKARADAALFTLDRKGSRGDAAAALIDAPDEARTTKRRKKLTADGPSLNRAKAASAERKKAARESAKRRKSTLAGGAGNMVGLKDLWGTGGADETAAALALTGDAAPATRADRKRRGRGKTRRPKGPGPATVKTTSRGALLLKGKQQSRTANAARDLTAPQSHAATKPDKWHASRQFDAVGLPHAGASVNPEMDDHQDALGMAVAAELAATEHGVGPRGPIPGEDAGDGIEWDDEEGDTSSDEEADDITGRDSAGEDDGTGATAKAKGVRRKFTRARRNKMARRKAAQEAAAAAEEEAALLASIDKAPAVTHSLSEEAKTRADRRLLRKIAKEERLANPGTIIGGKRVILRPSLDVALTDDLKESGGSLRKSKVMTAQSLMRDRFSRYKMRGMFEVGRHRGKKKGKVKVILPK